MSGTNAMWKDPHSTGRAVAVWDRTDKFMGLQAKDGQIINVNQTPKRRAFDGTVFFDPAADVLGNWQVTGTGAKAMQAGAGRNGGQALRVNLTAGNADVNPIDVTPVIDAAGRVGVWVYVPDCTKITGFSLKVSLGDASFTNGKFQSYTLSDGEKSYNGWHFVAYAGAEFGGTWGAPDFAVQAVATVRLGVVAAQSTYILLDQCVVGWRKRAAIMVTQDDGYASWFQYGLPVLDAFGIPATMSIIAGLIGTNANWATLDMMKAAYAQGHEFCAHGAAALSSLPSNAERAADIRANREFLLGKGFQRGTDFYIWPNGVYQLAPGDQTLIDMLKAEGVKAARGTTSPKSIKALDAQAGQRWLMPIIGADAGTSVATIKARIDAAVASGETVVLMYHEVIKAGAGSAISVTVSDLAEVMQHIANLRDGGKLDVITASTITDMM